MIFVLLSQGMKAQIDVNEIRARYSVLDEVKLKVLLDNSIQMEVESGAPAIEPYRESVISEYYYCEKHYSKIYALHFTIDIPLYVETGVIKLLFDHSLCPYDILYIDDDYGDKRKYRASATILDNSIADMVVFSKSRQRSLDKALSYNPEAVLHFFHSIYYTDVYLINNKLMYMKKGKRMKSFESFLRKEKPFLEASDRWRKEANWPIFSLEPESKS